MPDKAEFMKRTLSAEALRAYMGTRWVLASPARLFHKVEFTTSAYPSMNKPPVRVASGSLSSVARGAALLLMVFCNSTPPPSQYTAALARAVLFVTMEVESIRYSGCTCPSACGSPPRR